MAAGTVGYTDTRGNKDYTSIIASQIGRRLKEASNMASNERAFASKQAEAGGTSLEEAGVGKGYFFGRALGSRFGGDRIARAKGRMGVGGAGTNPATNYKDRFRGGFDYNVTNQSITDIAPLSNALVVGLRGVEQGLSDVAGAIQRQGTVLNKLSQNQADMAKATMFNGYLFAMFQSQQRQREGRESLRREESSIEGRGGRRIGGSSFGGAGGGRGMINVTGGSSGGGGGFGIPKSADTAQTALKMATNPKGAKNLAKGTASAFTGIGISYPAKLLQSAGKGIKNLLPGASASTGTSALMKRGAKIITGDTDIQLELLRSMDPLFTKLGGKGAMEIFDGSDTKHLLQLSLMDDGFNEAMANTFASASKNADGKAVQVLEDLMFKHNAKSIKSTDALDLLDFIKSGGLTSGMPMDEMNALARLEQIIGPEDFADLTDGISAPLKNADVPLAKLIPETVAAKTAKKAAAKSAAKLTGKSALKSVAKKIPLIAGLAGIGFGIQRALQGDLMGAGLEITSGILGATGVGTGLSFGIDGFLLARDLGMMPMAKGGIVKGMRGRGLPMMLGGGIPSLVGEGGSDEAVLPLNKKTFLSFGLGFIDAIKAKQSDFVKNLGMGVFSGIGDAARGGLFEGIGTGISNMIDGLKDMFGNFKDSFKETFNNLKESLGNTFNNFKDAVGKKINNIKQWWNKDSSDGSMIDNARFNVQKFTNRRILGKNDTKYMQGYNPTPGVTYGSLPSDYKETEAKYFQSAMYQPGVSNDSGVNLIPGSIVGNTYITNNYNGGGGLSGGSDDGNGNADISDLGSGFNEMVGAFALGTK